MSGPDPPWLALDDVERRYTTSQVRAMCAQLRPPRTRSRHDVTNPRAAAVLVPVVDADGQAAVLVTQRQSTMRLHRGDWVFPGGRVEVERSETARDAARREAAEELGIPAPRVDLVGTLDTHGPIVTGFVIEVFVAIVEGPLELAPDPREVAAVCTLPLSWCMSEAVFSRTREAPAHQPGPSAEGAHAPTRRSVGPGMASFVLPNGDQIWGTQGEILYDLLEQLAILRRADLDDRSSSRVRGQLHTWTRAPRPVPVGCPRRDREGEIRLQDLLPFIVIGLTAGSIYGLAGVGLVLTYKTSGVFNFAYGAIAAVAAFVFYDLWQREGLDWRIAAAISILVLGPLMGVLLELLTRMLSRVSTEYQVVGMVGLALGISGALTLWSSTWSDSASSTLVPDFLPTETFKVGSVNIGYNQATTMGIALLSTIALYLYFRYARAGVSMRAVVDDPDLVNIMGTNPITVRRFAWIIGTVFAAMSGVLLVPTIGLNSLLLILLVVQAFGAAAVGYFSNLPLTYAGGLLIGVAASISTKYIGTISWLGGLPASLPFIVLFVALLVTPKRLLALRRAAPPPPPRTGYRAPARVSIGLAVIAVGGLLLVPSIVGTNLSFWTVGVMTIILFLSLGLLVRESGQVSLCQYAFAAVGAAAFCHLVSDHGIPFLVALPIAGLVAVPVGLAVALPAIRLSGVFLALATLGFGILLEKMLYLQDIMFGPTADGIHAVRPSFASSDEDYYFLVLAVTVVCCILVVAIVRGRLGRLLRGLRDSPLALDTEGATTNVTRILVFCISSFLAGIYGALYAGFLGSVNGATFPSFASLTIIAVVVLAVGGTPWYALLAAGLFTMLPSYVDIDNIQAYLQIAFGAAVVGSRDPVAEAAVGTDVAAPGPGHARRPEARGATDADAGGCA